jgi:ppGpp synthetase/RelA/SpoT-type nucleotidyltranferase
VARIDSSALVKSPGSILEKMVRDWEPNGGSPPAIGFRNFLQEMEDVGRFRVVANFLSDVERITNALEAPFGPSSTPLTPAQRALKDDYRLRQNCLHDSVYLLPEQRKKGERCRKGVFYPRARSLEHLKVEVQVQTLLQEAWDKKDHFLVYERRRRGEVVNSLHAMEIFAMSELLYVADLTFDRLRLAIDSER